MKPNMYRLARQIIDGAQGRRAWTADNNLVHVSRNRIGEINPPAPGLRHSESCGSNVSSTLNERLKNLIATNRNKDYGKLERPRYPRRCG